MPQQGSTLYSGSVTKDMIYQITQGVGFEWGDHVKTEVLVDRKPRQLTKAKHDGNPITENELMPRDADFVGLPTTTIDGRQLSVAELMVKDTITPLEWKETFPNYQPSGLNIDLKANPQIAKTITDMMMDAAKNQMNELHASGDSSLISPDPMRFYDGFETLILADADATQVGTPAVLTEGNIIDYFFELRNAIDPRIRKNKDLKIFCSYADADLYDIAARKTQDSSVIVTLGGQRQIVQTNGSVINIIPVEGISKDFVFATVANRTPKSNLKQGVWMERDSETLKVYKSEEADQVWKIVMRFDMGVQFVTGDDIWYLNNV